MIVEGGVGWETGLNLRGGLENKTGNSCFQNKTW